MTAAQVTARPREVPALRLERRDLFIGGGEVREHAVETLLSVVGACRLLLECADRGEDELTEVSGGMAAGACERIGRKRQLGGPGSAPYDGAEEAPGVGRRAKLLTGAAAMSKRPHAVGARRALGM